MASRINYQTILAKYKKLGKGNVRLTQSSLILSQAINANKTVYNFDVLETQNQSLSPEEIRLNLNDEFIISQIGLFLQADMLDRATGALTGVKKLFSYAPSQLDVVEGAKVQNFFAGQLQISVNNIVYLDKYDTRKHEFVPRTQLQNLTAASYGATQDSNDFAKNGMYGMEPLLTLSGAKKNQITLALPTAIAPATFAWVDDKGQGQNFKIDRVVCLLRGLNAQNGAVFQGATK